jgi:UDP-N-acetyl-D-galactosamine dehydrogenase
MGMFVANKVIKLMIKKGHRVAKTKALILGITFKENCPDIRNSRVIDIYNELIQFDLDIDVYDPHADKHEVSIEYGLKLIDQVDDKYDAIILAVAHNEFLTLDYKAASAGDKTVIFDTKSFLDRSLVDARL